MFKGRPFTPPMWSASTPDVSARDAAIARLEAEVERLRDQLRTASVAAAPEAEKDTP
jgi:hypothetical protein